MESLVPKYKEMLAADPELFRGLSILAHKKTIERLVRKHDARRLLDYGCGRGDAYRHQYKVHRDWGLKWFDVDLYDPSFREHAEKPHGLYDGVLCSDVLEHIPEEELDAILTTLASHTRKFFWASVCCRPANKSFPDGGNVHVTLQPMDWWRERVARIFPGTVEVVLTETE